MRIARSLPTTKSELGGGRAVFIPAVPGRERSSRKLAKAIAQAVYLLHRRRRVLKRRIRQGALSDVDQQPDAVRHILLEGQHNAVGDFVGIQRGRFRVDLENRRARGHELA